MGRIIKGVVIHGKKLGRKLGFPTANIRLEDGMDVQEGVYAVRATVEGVSYEGMASVGRSSVDRSKTGGSCGGMMLEANLFGFEDELYGKIIEVELLEKVRDMKRFGSTEELKAAVDEDRRTIKEYFKTK